MAFRRDWICESCGIKSVDVPTRIPDQWCPYCGVKMKKIVSAPMVLFKGDGWTSPSCTVKSKEDANG